MADPLLGAPSGLHSVGQQRQGCLGADEDAGPLGWAGRNAGSCVTVGGPQTVLTILGSGVALCGVGGGDPARRLPCILVPADPIRYKPIKLMLCLRVRLHPDPSQIHTALPWRLVPNHGAQAGAICLSVLLASG